MLKLLHVNKFSFLFLMEVWIHELSSYENVAHNQYLWFKYEKYDTLHENLAGALLQILETDDMKYEDINKKAFYKGVMAGNVYLGGYNTKAAVVVIPKGDRGRCEYMLNARVLPKYEFTDLVNLFEEYSK